MSLVGRKGEQAKLRQFLDSGKAEFVVVYGRRRVGKTFLVSEYFHDSFAFHVTGLSGGRMPEQLAAFDLKLAEYGFALDRPSASWLEAFTRLKALLKQGCGAREERSGRQVVFIDEMPWLDTPRSGFKAALEFFWNDWASRQHDLMLVVCGSATSWIAKNLLENKGGLYNRVTRIIDLQPFTPSECRSYFESRGMAYTAQQMVECAMVFGGIPFYLDLLDSGKSLAHSIDELCFEDTGQLRHEFDRLFATLFKHPEAYVKVVKALARKKTGMTRTELRKIGGFEGSRLTAVLSDLELCGFVRGYRGFSRKTRGTVFQLIDPFTLFHLKFIGPGKVQSWTQSLGTSAYNAWCGNAFEMYCLNNVAMLKAALGISGVSTNVSAWRSAKASPGAQIDLLIDRADNVINVCEMKYSRAEYSITAAYEKELRNKLAVFEEEAKPGKALHLTLVTLNGVRRNEHYNAVVLNEVCVSDMLGLR